MFGRDKMAMILAEFMGTYVLASVVLAMLGRTTFPFFMAVAAGVTLATMIVVFGNNTKVHLNPAVTISNWLVGAVGHTTAVVLVAAQMLGGVVAWTVNQYLLGTALRNAANKEFDWRLFAAEALGAFLFTMVLASVVKLGYAGSKAAVVSGAGLTLGILVASFAGNGIINPAVALGVQSWSFIYAAAPIVGAILGTLVYNFVFAPRTLRQKLSAAVKSAVKKPAKKPAKKSKK